MKFKNTSRLGAIAVAACLAFSQIPAFAVEDGKISVSFTDVTSSASTLAGEAKVMISVEGAEGKATIAQMALDFEGDLKYKSTNFLKGENNPDNGCSWIEKKASDKKLMTSIIATDGITFGDNEDLFIITFSGNPGETVTLNLSDLENTYCNVNGEDRNADGEKEITLTASDKENKGITAGIRLTMDKVLDFTGTGESGITVKITSDTNVGDTISTSIDTASVSNGGHRDGTSSTPTFIIENTVVADDTYTVEVSGIGYVTYKKSGIKFTDELKITNADFIPGDVNNDGIVNDEDKAAVEQLISDKEYSIAADFNRDGKVNSADLEVFDSTSGGNSGSDNTGGSTGGGGGSSSGGGSTGGGGGGSSSGGGSTGGGGGSSSGGGSIGGGFSGGAGTAASSKETFTDLGNHAWAKDAIYTLKDKGIISGVSDTEFAPANNIKRGDFILILTRMLSVNDEFTENFADVPESAYYYNAVGSAKAAGIAQGSENGFMPENSITRQDLITLAYRAFLAKGYISETSELTSLDAFGDKGDISDYAQTAMASMVNAGIIQGSDGKVNPKGFATRAEVAVMCARLCELMK